MLFYCRMESQGEESEDVEMKEEENKEVEPQPEVFEQQKRVEQPAPAKDKKMLSVEERMKEFRDMMLERSVSADYMRFIFSNQVFSYAIGHTAIL